MGSAVKSGDGHAVDFDGERFGAQALAVAGRALGGGHVLHHPLAVGVGFGFFERVAQIREDAVEAGAGGFGLRRSDEEKFLLFEGELLEGVLRGRFCILRRRG